MTCVNVVYDPKSQEVKDAHGWGGLLGAAFPSITCLAVNWYYDVMQQWRGPTPILLDVPFMSGLSACRHLTKLCLGRAECTAALASCTHLLTVWLLHVHTLECNGLQLVRGLAAQLQNVVLVYNNDAAEAAAVLGSCQQLVSIDLPELSHPVLDALIPLPHLRTVVASHSKLQESRADAQWAVETLRLEGMNDTAAALLPLASLQRLEITNCLGLDLQPGAEDCQAAMHAAASALAQVPSVQLQNILFCHHDDEWDDQQQAFVEFVHLDDCSLLLGEALRGVQPLADHLPHLTLTLTWLDTFIDILQDEDIEDMEWQELGPEPLHGLHAALGAGLTSLCIEPSTKPHHYWVPTEGFWQALSGMQVLPQLQNLVLEWVLPLSAMSWVALTVMCSMMHRAGRWFELVLKHPLRPAQMLAGVQQLRVYEPLVRVRVISHEWVPHE